MALAYAGSGDALVGSAMPPPPPSPLASPAVGPPVPPSPDCPPSPPAVLPRESWADLAEAADVAVGRPIACRDRIPPRAPVRPPPSVPAGGPTPRGGSSASRGTDRRHRRPSGALPSPGSKEDALGSRAPPRRRRAGGWGVAGRTDRGAALDSWRSPALAAFASAPAGQSPAATLALSGILVRRAPFREGNMS